MEVGEERVAGGRMWIIDVVVVCIAATQKDTDK